MIIHLVLILLIIILLCNSITFNTIYRCPKYPLKIKYVRASRLPGKQFTERVGIDTLNIKLDRDVPCGLYKLTTTYGKGVMFVGSANSRLAYLNMDNMDVLSGVNLLDMWDIQRLESEDNGFIQTYNRGCCN
ncbi:hypothetical protein YASMINEVIRUS_1063 [Yasminevirus sp. GU-2018]|uniref:Uncharacterized protein n=1 Tax=Yasminevirus sp. GU-2018 TaxID=2420051 RepID=A0A5K0UA81_9VIRU|nr:hypothetical protein YASMINEVIRUS_1063 [Yasminevirus sp. GU-2018]